MMVDGAFPTVKLDSYPFPFVGAGEAQYFEWAEVHVVFERPPTAAEQEKIAADVPAPLTDSVDFDDIYLMVASDQFAHVAMAETYEADPGDEGLEEDSDDYGRFFFAAGSQVQKFNADTERWLKATHEVCPIAVAFRAEDMEAGGTELSDWHSWSVEQSDALFEQLQLDAANDEDHPGHFVVVRLIDVLSEADRPIPDELRDLVDPGFREVELLEAGDVAGLREALLERKARSEPTLERLMDALDGTNPNHRAAMPAIAQFLRDAGGGSSWTLKNLTTAVLDGEGGDELFSTICDAAADSEWGLGYVGSVAYEMIRAQRWEDALRLFDVLVTYESKDRTVYNNALYAVMADNSGLGLQPERARRYIDAARPYGEENPSIFYNIACAEMELGDVDATLENTRLALEHGYSKPQQIRDDEILAPLKNDPRFTALFDD